MGNFEALCNEYRENKRLIEELEDYKYKSPNYSIDGR